MRAAQDASGIESGAENGVCGGGIQQGWYHTPLRLKVEGLGQVPGDVRRALMVSLWCVHVYLTVSTWHANLGNGAGSMCRDI